MSSVRSGRGAGATMPPRDIALITPPGYRPRPGRRHEPYVYKTGGGTLTLCTGTNGATACSTGRLRAPVVLRIVFRPLARTSPGGRLTGTVNATRKDGRRERSTMAPKILI